MSMMMVSGCSIHVSHRHLWSCLALLFCSTNNNSIINVSQQVEMSINQAVEAQEAYENSAGTQCLHLIHHRAGCSQFAHCCAAAVQAHARPHSLPAFLHPQRLVLQPWRHPHRSGAPPCLPLLPWLMPVLPLVAGLAGGSCPGLPPAAPPASTPGSPSTAEAVVKGPAPSTASAAAASAACTEASAAVPTACSSFPLRAAAAVAPFAADAADVIAAAKAATMAAAASAGGGSATCGLLLLAHRPLQPQRTEQARPAFRQPHRPWLQPAALHWQALLLLAGVAAAVLLLLLAPWPELLSAGPAAVLMRRLRW